MNIFIDESSRQIKLGKNGGMFFACHLHQLEKVVGPIPDQISGGVRYFSHNNMNSHLDYDKLHTILNWFDEKIINYAIFHEPVDENEYSLVRILYGNYDNVCKVGWYEPVGDFYKRRISHVFNSNEIYEMKLYIQCIMSIVHREPIQTIPDFDNIEDLTKWCNSTKIKLCKTITHTSCITLWIGGGGGPLFSLT